MTPTKVTGSPFFGANSIPAKTNMTLENPHFSIGNTFSDGGFSIVILVFGGCTASRAFKVFGAKKKTAWKMMVVW